MAFGESYQMSKIPMFQVALANINFVNVFLLQEFLHTSLKLSDNTGISVRPMVKETFKTITQFWILFKVLLQGQSIRIVANNDDISVIEPMSPEISKRQIDTKTPGKNPRYEKRVKRKKIVSGNKIGFGRYDVNRNQKNMIENCFNCILCNSVKALNTLNCERLQNQDTSEPGKNRKKEKPIIDWP